MINNISNAATSIWIIDDEKDFCTILSKALTKSLKISDITSFLNPDDALMNLRHGAVHPTVILLDLNMTRASGLNYIRPFKQVAQDTSIIILTGHENEAYIRDALKLGIDGYVLKTSGLKHISDCITNVIEGKKAMDPQIVQKIFDIYRHDPASPVTYNLTEREQEILSLIVKGKSKQEISEQLLLSFHTIDTHFKNIFNKLHVHTVQSLIAKVLNENLI